MPRPSKREAAVTEGGANLFADFGIANATEKNTKVQLAVAINQVVKSRGLKQLKAAALIGCTQPDVSLLANYKLEAFSVERLMDFLLALGNDIEITVRPKAKRAAPARTTVTLKEAA